MKQPVLTHENRKAWTFLIETIDDQGQPLDITGWQAQAQLRSKLDNRLIATLTMNNGLSYTHPNLTVAFSPEQLDTAPGAYTIGLEYIPSGGLPMDTIRIDVELIKLFIPA